ncbi:Meiosis-specific serine/threonine-protein kinase mek1 [Tulasnella sp. 331]|nr:Meiosis-specific serine/threonine-protein kinase mek1 [Tulasnella sp. 331]KAG8887207.1 Meiosis-specific serine/threonine-protein kinase mek1 [Tulasnella sp. 332]
MSFLPPIKASQYMPKPPPKKRRCLEDFKGHADWTLSSIVLPELQDCHAKLVTRNALGIPEEIYVALDRPVTVGRHNCTYMIQDTVVSKLHFNIYATQSPSGGTFLSCQELTGDLSPLNHHKDFSRNGTLWNDHLVHKTAIIVADGDLLQIPQSQTFRVCIRHKFDTNIQLSQQAPHERPDVTSVKYKQFGNYLVSNQTLGTGAFGKVRLAIDRTHHRQLACKTVQTSQSSTAVKMSVRKEVAILRDLAHPNINKIVDVIFDALNADTHIFLELCTGGDLLQFIELRKAANPHGGVSDGEGKYIGFQLMLALQYLHARDICHRDLKPENVLLQAPGPYPRVMLADFGFARDKSSERTTSICGTVSYVPPESLGGMYLSRGSNLPQQPQGYLGAIGLHPFDYRSHDDDEPGPEQQDQQHPRLVVVDDCDRGQRLPSRKRIRRTSRDSSFLNASDSPASGGSGVTSPANTRKARSSGCVLQDCRGSNLDDYEDGDKAQFERTLSEQVIKERIANGQIRFQWAGWARRRPAMLMILKLLHPDPTMRMTIDQALQSRWILEDVVTLEALYAKKIEAV